MLNTVLEILLLLAIVDTYLYWVHVIMHRVSFLWEIHKYHHAAYAPSFHVFEFCILWLLPMTAAVYFDMTKTMFVIAFIFVFEVGVTHKLNYRPSKFHRNLFKPFRSFLGTASYHKRHHTYPDVNFSQMFIFWDILMNTRHKAHLRRSK